MRKLILAVATVCLSFAVPSGVAEFGATAAYGASVCGSGNANWWYFKDTLGGGTIVTGSSPVSPSTSYTSALGTTYDVASNYWNPQALALTMYGCNYNSETTTGIVDNEGGAVQAYPEDWVNLPVENTLPYNPLPLTDYTSLTSKWGITNPPTASGNDYEFAKDDFICAAEWSNCTEIMVWTYTDGQIPICAPGGSSSGVCLSQSNVSIDGGTYNIYVDNDGSSPDTVTYESTTNSTSGTLDMLAFYDYAATSGWTASGAGEAGTLAVASSFGPEICATPAGGSSFEVTDYNVKWTLAS